MAKPPKFEGSKFDNDKGVKEGSKEDKARDKGEKAKMFQAFAKKGAARKK